MKRGLLLGGVGLLAVALALSASHALPAIPLLALRWIAIALLVAYGCYKRSLTAWILIAMVFGAEFGHDWPQRAAHIKVIAQIFLQLIKVIIAPLLFGTLVSGIAGHADLKKVGRMGIKAIVYFELVTTVALFIGLGAINLSKAGGGGPPPRGRACAAAGHAPHCLRGHPPHLP